MEQKNTYLNITERDVDLLFLEELLVSQNFSAWFVSMVYQQEFKTETLDAWHSVSDSDLGESDLIYKFECEAKGQHVILIENKIDAVAQPDQGLRYRLRGEKGIERGDWVSFKTCLLAPQRYLESNTETYDAELSYEQTIEHFFAKSCKRSMYRAEFLREAVEKNRRGYQQVVSERMTTFAKHYLDYVAANFPELNPEPARPRAAGHSWIHFYPIENHRDTAIVHQVNRRMIKVMYKGQIDRFDEIASRFKGYLENTCTVKRSGKSVVVEVKSPEIDPLSQEFNQVLDEIIRTINIALKLKEKI